MTPAISCRLELCAKVDPSMPFAAARTVLDGGAAALATHPVADLLPALAAIRYALGRRAGGSFCVDSLVTLVIEDRDDLIEALASDLMWHSGNDDDAFAIGVRIAGVFDALAAAEPILPEIGLRPDTVDRALTWLNEQRSLVRRARRERWTMLVGCVGALATMPAASALLDGGTGLTAAGFPALAVTASFGAAVASVLVSRARRAVPSKASG